MRKTFKKMRPRVINYRSYRDFSNETFRVSLINNLSNEVFVNNDDGLEKFCKITMDITPLHKKGRKDNMENYRPVSILPILSKILERILFEQIPFTLISFYKTNNVDFEKDRIHKIVY